MNLGNDIDQALDSIFNVLRGKIVVEANKIIMHIEAIACIVEFKNSSIKLNC